MDFDTFTNSLTLLDRFLQHGTVPFLFDQSYGVTGFVFMMVSTSAPWTHFLIPTIPPAVEPRIQSHLSPYSSILSMEVPTGSPSSVQRQLIFSRVDILTHVVGTRLLSGTIGSLCTIHGKYFLFLQIQSNNDVSGRDHHTRSEEATARYCLLKPTHFIYGIALKLIALYLLGLIHITASLRALP
jgi:hypothetical protein